MFYWIYDIPNEFLAGLICLACVLYTWSGILILRPCIFKWLGPEPGENEFVTGFLSAYGVFYGLMLGLIAVATYQNYCDVGDRIEKEVANITALYRDVSSYPEPERSNFQNKLREYMNHIIDDGWTANKNGNISPKGMLHTSSLQKDLFAYQPQTKSIEILHVETIQQFNRFILARSSRLQSVTTGLPDILWYVVIIGAMLNLSFIWMFSIDRVSIHLILSGILSLFIGLMLFFLAAMDNPYRGVDGITPDAYQGVLKRLMTPIP